MRTVTMHKHQLPHDNQPTAALPPSELEPPYIRGFGCCVQFAAHTRSLASVLALFNVAEAHTRRKPFLGSWQAPHLTASCFRTPTYVSTPILLPVKRKTFEPYFNGLPSRARHHEFFPLRGQDPRGAQAIRTGTTWLSHCLALHCENILALCNTRVAAVLTRTCQLHTHQH